MLLRQCQPSSCAAFFEVRDVVAEAAAGLPVILRKSLGGRMTIASLVCVCVLARAFFLRSCVRAFVRSCVRTRVCVCVCVWWSVSDRTLNISYCIFCFCVCVCVCVSTLSTV